MLTEAREATGLSQREVSKRLNQSAPYIWAIEKGDRTVDLVEFIDIAAVLGVNPVELFTRVFIQKD